MIIILNFLVKMQKFLLRKRTKKRTKKRKKKENKTKDKQEGYQQPGYSVLLFDKSNGKAVNEGDLIERIFNYYHSAIK